MPESPVNPLTALYIAESLFGVCYAGLIHWIAVNGYLSGSTAYQVVIGDAVTLLIEWAFIPAAWSPVVTFTCFIFSGLPMVISYLIRHEARVESHKRKIITGAGARVRDYVVMDLSALADDMAAERTTNASNVHRVHQAIGTLKSL